jgi:DnaJ-class molecular chaperone
MLISRLLRAVRKALGLRTPCPRCGGEGRLAPVHFILGRAQGGWTDCPRCGGRGRL